MSHQAVNWAIEQRAGGPAPKATLWSIANYANEDWCSWPSQQTIAAESEQSPDTVQRQIKHLEAGGLIRRIPMRYAGRRSNNFYILKPSIYFDRALTEIEPILPRGYSPIVRSDEVDSSQSDLANEAANCGSDEAATGAANEAATDAALVRQQVNPGTSEPMNQDSDSARARDGYSPEAAGIASEIATIAGVDETKHAKWFIAGPALIVQRWLDGGYQRWQLIEGVKRAMAKRTGPPDTIIYFGPLWQRVRGEAELEAPAPTAPEPRHHSPRNDDLRERNNHAREQLRAFAYGPDTNRGQASSQDGGSISGGLPIPKST